MINILIENGTNVNYLYISSQTTEYHYNYYFLPVFLLGRGETTGLELSIVVAISIALCLLDIFFGDGTSSSAALSSAILCKPFPSTSATLLLPLRFTFSA